MTLTDAFDHVFVLNLAHRPDRRKRVLEHLKEVGMMDGRSEGLEVVPAVSGDLLPPPKWWGAGNGAWGCLLSHSLVLQRALAAGYRSWLVLEDDVVFHPRAVEHLSAVLDAAPADWGQLYLGGQHLKEPTTHNELLYRASNVNRTHAFAMTARVAAKVHAHIWHAPDYIERKGWHIDHQLGLAHERNEWPVYAPKWWLAGQDAGSSNISARQLPRHFWQPSAYSAQLPFFFGRPDTAEQINGLHYGNNHRPDRPYSDTGLNDALGNASKTTQWLHLIAREAISLGRLPAAWHECTSLAELQPLWPAGVHPVDRFDDDLLDYPFNGLFDHPFAALGRPQAPDRPAAGLPLA